MQVKRIWQGFEDWGRWGRMCRRKSASETIWEGGLSRVGD